jgi:hypothetical protein
MVTNTRGTTDTRRVRRLKTPRAVEVEAGADGVPVRLHLGATWHEVSLARRPWRVDQYWWRAEAVCRVYYRLSSADRPALTVYHDLVTGAWAQQEY